MTFEKNDHWICQNKDCLAELIVIAPSRLHEGQNPRCLCGGIMKKPYSVPKFKVHDPRDPEFHLLVQIFDATRVV